MMNYIARIDAARARISPARVSHCVVFEDPDNLDAPMKILHPNSRCVAELMAGGVHPPIDAHHTVPLRLTGADGEVVECTRVEADFKKRAMQHPVEEQILDYSRCHNEVMGPLSYEEAVEYVLQKDVPARVWAADHNRQMFAIVPLESLPKDRSRRNAWRLSECL